MSLIINMLKDLEKRDKNSQTIPNITRRQPTTHFKFLSYFHLPSSRWFAVLLLITALIMLLITTKLIYSKNKVSAHVIKPLPAQSMSTENDTSSAVILPMKKVQIGSITIQSGEKSTIMHFNLNNEFLYRMASRQNHFYLTFENADLQSALPETALDHMLIKSISSKKINDDLQVDIALNSDWEIKSATTDTHNKNYDFKIDIESTKKLSPVAPTIKMTDTIKKPVSDNALQEQYKFALAAAQKGNKKGAINQLYSLITNASDYHLGRTSLIALLIDTGRLVDADAALNEGLQLAPDYVPYIELKARLLSMNNDVNGAIALLQRSAPEITDYPDYYAFLAALYEQENRDSLAAGIYKQLVQIEPKNGNWWFGLALSMDKAGNRKEAVYAYNKALSKGQLNSTSLSYLQRRLSILREENNEAS